MWTLLRKTARRGRVAVPRTRRRTRWWRRSRRSRLAAVLMSSSSLAGGGLARLAADTLTLVADPLALVRLGLADHPDVRGRLADEHLVDAGHDDAVRCRHREIDPL